MVSLNPLKWFRSGTAEAVSDAVAVDNLDPFAYAGQTGAVPLGKLNLRRR